MQETSLQKEQHHHSLTENAVVRWFRDAFHPVLMKLSRSALTFAVQKDNDYVVLPGRPVIFVANHYCGQDVVIACNVLKERVKVVAGKQNLTPMDEFFFNMNGTIFVDRKDRKDTAACKRAMEATLNSGRNVVIFPEGTSNVSDALLMYPMKWGVIDVAQRTGAQLVPMVLDYDKTEKICHVRFCEPMVVDGLSKQEGIELLRNTMASVRWQFMEEKGEFSRENADIAELRRQNMELLLSYKLLDYDYERSVVFKPYPTAEDVFAPIERLCH